MTLKNINLEELKLMTYADITYQILKENKNSYSTLDLFKKICNLLEYDESAVSDKIGDYYTVLNNDKRFVILDSGKWDIRDRHSINLSLEDDDEEIEEESEEEEEIEEESEEEDDEDIEVDLDEIDEEDDGLDQLSIVLDEEEEN